MGITFEFQVPNLMFHLALFTFSWGFLRLLRIVLKIVININFFCCSRTMNITGPEIDSIENGPVIEIDEREKKDTADAKKLIKINTSVEETQLSKCAKSV